MYAPSVDIEAEALDLAEGAAKLAFGTRFKRVPRAILRKLSVPVVFVLGVIVVLYSTAMGVVNRWMENSVPGMLNCGILTVNAALGLVMYLCCVYRDPGRVPVGWKPDAEAGGALLELKRKGGSRFCKKCVRHKPPRTHHCRVCNRCVLRMDHHCVWVNNCVGHRNYKSFFLFLLYITAACVHALGIFAQLDRSDFLVHVVVVVVDELLGEPSVKQVTRLDVDQMHITAIRAACQDAVLAVESTDPLVKHDDRTLGTAA